MTLNANGGDLEHAYDIIGSGLSIEQSNQSTHKPHNFMAIVNALAAPSVYIVVLEMTWKFHSWITVDYHRWYLLFPKIISLATNFGLHNAHRIDSLNLESSIRLTSRRLTTEVSIRAYQPKLS